MMHPPHVEQPHRTDTEREQDTSEWRVETLYRIDALEAAVAKNTALTEAVKKNTDDIVAFFEAGKGTFKVLKAVGVAAKWVTTVTVACAALYVMWRGK